MGLAVPAVLTGLILSVVAPAVQTTNASSGIQDPVRAFDKVFALLEQAWGIDIAVSNMKLELFSGQVSIQGIDLTHPAHGNFAKASGIHFPFGVLVGASDPSKTATVLEGFHLAIDFGKDRFWKTSASNGKPVPGAPDLRIGKLKITDGTFDLSNGTSAGIRIAGFAGVLSNLDVEGKTWSAGSVPADTWAEATLTNGTVSYGPIPDVLQLDEATFHFDSNVLHIDKLRGDLEGGGSVSMNGRIEMAGGTPSRYDLDVTIDDARIERQSVSAVASGDLTIKGSPSKVKIAGKLSLSDVKRLYPAKWSFPGCKGQTSLSVSLQQASGSSGSWKKSNLEGTLCKGRLEQQ